MARRNFMEDSMYTKGDRLAVGLAYSQGLRDYMQDCFAVVFQYELDPQVDFLGVYDGHDVFGERVSQYLAEQLSTYVLRKMINNNYQNLEKIIQSAFIEFDQYMSKLKLLEDTTGQLHGGSTAVCLWIRQNTIISANTGDSRAVMSIKGKAVPITFDHKPRLATEHQRIRKAGGFVQDDRVQGVLAVSRAFGDYMFKKTKGLSLSDQMVTALPDVRVIQMDKDLEFVVVGSDGLWDCFTNQQAVDMIWKMIKQNMSLDSIANAVMKSCIAKPGSMSPVGRDNITVIIAVPLTL